jgi:hypothetical protein
VANHQERTKERKEKKRKPPRRTNLKRPKQLILQKEDIITMVVDQSTTEVANYPPRGSGTSDITTTAKHPSKTIPYGSQ